MHKKLNCPSQRLHLQSAAKRTVDFVSMHDLYWLPSVALVAYEWLWLWRSGNGLRPVHSRLALGIAALLLATGASLSLLAAVVHSWVIGHFTWLPLFGGWGFLVGFLAVLAAFMAEGMLRILTLISGALSAVASYAYLGIGVRASGFERKRLSAAITVNVSQFWGIIGVQRPCRF